MGSRLPPAPLCMPTTRAAACFKMLSHKRSQTPKITVLSAAPRAWELQADFCLSEQNVLQGRIQVPKGSCEAIRCLQGLIYTRK